jgi:D-amino-acid dehydrogenase
LKQAIVIGGGVVGLCSAYYLAKSGIKVTLLERGAEHHDCCSLGNAGMVVPSHFEPLASPGMVGYGMRMMLRRSSPFGFKASLNPDLMRWGWLFARSCSRANVQRGSKLLRDMHMASRSLYEEMAAESGNAFELRKNGLAMICHSEKALSAELKLADHAEALGLRVRRLSRLDVELLETGIRMRGAGGVHFLDDCHLDPQGLHVWLHAQLAEMGVDVRYSHSALGFVSEGGQVKTVKTNHGDFAADEYVIAAGSWSGQLAKKLGFRMPMQGGKGYSMDVPVTSPPENCFILVEARLAVTPIGGRLRFAGTMEIVGDDLGVNEHRVRGIVDSIPRYMPDFQAADFRDLGVWSGLRPVSADGLPYLGRPKILSNVVFAAGHGMMGVSLGPVSGILAANIVSGRENDIDVACLAPDRFN